MNNQAFYIWLQQGQDLWDQIKNFTSLSNNKDTLTIIISSTAIIISFTTIDNFCDTLQGTWKERYQKTVKKYPAAIYIYDAVELLQKMGIDLYPFTIEPTARMMVDGNLLRQIWHWWQIRTTLPYLINLEGIFEPRDGQIEAKGKQIEIDEYISSLLNLLLKLSKQYPTEMFSSLVEFGYKIYGLNYYEEALKCINKSLDIAKNKSILFESISSIWLLHGNILCDFGRGEEAIVSYDIAINIKSDDYEIWYNKGIALERLEKNEEAIASYDKALEIKPDFDDAWYSRGISMKNLGRNEEAIASYNKAIEIKPDFDDAWNNKGNILHQLGRDEESLEAFNKAIIINPKNHLIWYNKGLILKYLQQYEEAIKAYDEVIKLKPDYYEAWNDKGNALIYMKQSNQALKIYEEAISAYNFAINIKPDFYPAWYNRAICYAMLENFDQVIYNLRQAINLNPEEYRDLVKSHSVFDNIRNDGRFQALLQE